MRDNLRDKARRPWGSGSIRLTKVRYWEVA